MVNKEPFSFLIHSISKLHRNAIKEELDNLGINPTYRYIFYCVLSNPDKKVTQSDICEFTHLKAPSISLVLQEMESNGYILRVKDTQDSRKTFVTITEKGTELDNQLRNIFKEKEADICSCMSEEEQEQLYPILIKILNHMKGDEADV